MNMHRRISSRAGFTLIELLVVIAIIAVLVALTTGAVIRVLRVQPEKETTRELLGLSEKVDMFFQEFGFYPPSKMVLCPARANYTTSALDQQSLAVIDKMFPTLGNFSGVDWTGVGAMPAREELDGDQCLVFFLGGPNTMGFAKSGNPGANKATTPQRFGPYYEFKQHRLVARSGKVFRSYLDPYSTVGSATESSPYAFFSTGMSKRYSAAHAHLGIDQGPYKNPGTPAKYLRADSFQIISAGHDHKFGPGGLWDTAIANSQFTKDDQANFHDRILGAKGN